MEKGHTGKHVLEVAVAICMAIVLLNVAGYWNFLDDTTIKITERAFNVREIYIGILSALVLIGRIFTPLVDISIILGASAALLLQHAFNVLRILVGAVITVAIIAAIGWLVVQQSVPPSPPPSPPHPVTPVPNPVPSPQAVKPVTPEPTPNEVVTPPLDPYVVTPTITALIESARQAEKAGLCNELGATLDSVREMWGNGHFPPSNKNLTPNERRVRLAILSLDAKHRSCLAIASQRKSSDQRETTQTGPADPPVNISPSPVVTAPTVSAPSVPAEPDCCTTLHNYFRLHDD